MVDIDLENIQILTSKDIDMVELSNVKELNKENTYLKYGLIISFFLIIGFSAYVIQKKNDEKD